MSENKADEAARRGALWALYALDVTDVIEVDEFLSQSFGLFMEEREDVAEAWESLEERVYGVLGKMDTLNEQIQALSPRWKLERMATVDRNLLRLGCWEILEGFCRPIVTINGCVDLAKEYGGKSTPAFVNGLLDQLCSDHKIEIV